MKKVTTLVFVIFCIPAFAVEKAQLNSAISIQYGTVESVNKEKIKSSAGKNALVGGMLGAATSGKKDRKTHAVQGAVALGLLTAIAEGKHEAYAYQVDMINGSVLKVISEHSGIQSGDCVSIEQGKTTNIRRVSAVHCEHHDHDALQHEEVVQNRHEDAEACHLAKEKAMDAQTEDELDVALKKVRVFCGH